jgi:FAD/FMN-containing dehydrogenase
LLCGSLGVLGIITEVSLKVLPLPRLEATLQLELPAAAAVQTFNRLAGEPLPLSAAAWNAGIARVRLSGAAPAVRAARARIGGELLEEPSAHAWWQGLRDCTLPFFAAPSSTGAARCAGMRASRPGSTCARRRVRRAARRCTGAGRLPGSTFIRFRRAAASCIGV